ncbi:hypothetical protein ACFFTN_06765 [Aminobacter aganoensis]|uniref:Uncharacterized protein n=1 Tax=Aminobacter aganoensis TaxID=83264 RepID=A0A7X0FCN2_9HYPH|nr:hypothetical protein [Aminobacter aganoensis]MBB6357291.1 hypothetical protein [Aminobacter aganoensis]
MKDYLGVHQQVAGAGKLGKALWFIGGIVLNWRRQASLCGTNDRPAAALTIFPTLAVC